MAEAQLLGQAVPSDPIRTRVSLLALIGALLLSLIGDQLFYAAGIGLNIPLWSLLLLGAWWGITRAGQWSASRTQVVLAGLAWLLTAFVAWRDSITLNTLAILSAFLLVSMAAYPWVQGLMRGSLLEYCLLMPLYTVAQLTGGLLLLILRDVKWRSLRQPYSIMQRLRRGLTGLLLALPFLVLFGILFASADAVFHTFLKNIFQLNIDSGRLWLIGFWTWLAGGLLRLLLFPEDLSLDPSVEQVARVNTPRVGSIEMGVALGLINLLFLGFVLVQLRYLFGGASAGAYHA